jgi:hypothetical protein
VNQQPASFELWFRKTTDGWRWQVAPLIRAMMRVEAEMLLQDAEHISTANIDSVRTVEQRRADAFVALA